MTARSSSTGPMLEADWMVAVGEALDWLGGGGFTTGPAVPDPGGSPRRKGTPPPKGRIGRAVGHREHRTLTTNNGGYKP